MRVVVRGCFQVAKATRWWQFGTLLLLHVMAARKESIL